MKLPTEKRERIKLQFPENDSYLVYGPPKVGKTSLCATWPEVLLLDLEGGADYVEDAYVLEINTLSDLRDAYKELRDTDDMPYQTIAIDTIDQANAWIEDEVCREKGIDQMGEGSYGADWAMARNRVLNLIKMFSKLNINLLIVSHSKEGLFENGNGSKTIDLPGKLARFVMAFTDNILYCQARQNKDSVERKIILQPTASLEAGSRNPVLNEAGSCDLSYQALKALFDKEDDK